MQQIQPMTDQLARDVHHGRFTAEANLTTALSAVVDDVNARCELDATLEIDSSCAELPVTVWPGIDRVARAALADVDADDTATHVRVVVNRAGRNRIVLEIVSDGRTLDRSHFAATARLRRSLATGIRNFGSSLATISTHTGTSIQLTGPGGAPTHACATNLGGQS